MSETNAKLASNIRALAARHGVTVKQTLADCKINRNFLYDLEHGNSSPSVDKINRIAEYFGVSPAFIFGDDGPNDVIARFAKLYTELSEGDKELLRDYIKGLLSEESK